MQVDAGAFLISLTASLLFSALRRAAVVKAATFLY